MTDDIALRLKEALKLQLHPTIYYLSSDKRLSKLGDAIINYIASVSETIRGGIPMGLRVDNRTLTNAVKASGLRDRLSHRRDRHMLGDAAEALIAYSFIQGVITIEECVDTMLRSESIQGGMTRILGLAIERVGVTKCDLHRN